MKNNNLLILLIVLIAATISCVQKDNVDRDLAMYTQVWDDIVNKGQIDKINDSSFTSDVTMILEPENIVGIEAFKAYYQNFTTGFSDVNFTINESLGKGDKLVKHWTFKGKHTGDFFGIPATGRMVDLSGVTIAKMRDGKISQEQDFFDNNVFMQQLGIQSDPNNMVVINKLYEAFGVGDIPTVLSCLDSTVVWYEAEGNALADGNPYKGPEAVLNGVFARVGAQYDGFTLNDIQLHEMSNNQVLSTLRYKGKVKATGKSIDAQAAHLWTLGNGKVTGFQQYVDTKQLAESEKK